jgi:hypothetical protein
MTAQADVDLIAELRRKLDEAMTEAQRWEIYARRAIREHAETRDYLSSVMAENQRVGEALRFYLDADRRDVEAGTLETVAMRPAFEALGGQPSGICSAHRTPSKACRVCYPNPPRPRVTPVPSVSRDSSH